MNDLVQFLHLRLLAGDLENGHATADIDTNKARSDAVGNRHRCAYRAAFAGMDIRHDSDFAIL